MVLAVESKVYVPPSVIKTPARFQKSAGSLGDSLETVARAFVDSLPKDVRDRVGQAPRDAQKRDDSDRSQRSNQDAPTQKIQSSYSGNVFSPELDQEPAYSSPSLNPGAALLQVQLSSDEQRHSDRTSPSELALQARNQAYISSGAQPGGEAAAFAAAIERDELANTVLIVPPVITSVNLLA